MNTKEQQREHLDPAFWRAVIDLAVKQDPALKDPQLRKRVEAAILHLLEHSNTFLSIASSAIFHTAESVAMVRFVYFAQKLGFANHNIVTIFKALGGLHTAGAKNFILNVTKNLGGIGGAASKIAKSSAVFLVFTTSVQVLIYYRRGDYGLAAGELVKTIFAVMATPLAIYDLFDQLLCAFCPDFMNNPFVKILRMFPSSLQGVKHLANTIVTLVHIYMEAEAMGARDVNEKLNRLADEWEKSVFGVASETARGAVHYLACKAPWLMKYAWIKNLAEYHEKHPLNW